MYAELLSEQEIERVYEASLDVIQETGPAGWFKDLPGGERKLLQERA